MAIGVSGLIMQVILEEIHDGEWHLFQPVFARAANAVPPGVALRRAEYEREAQWLKTHPGMTKADMPPRRNMNDDQDYLIRVGARATVRRTINDSPAFQKSEDRKQIRLVPGRSYVKDEHGLWVREDMHAKAREKREYEAEQSRKRSARSKKAFATRKKNSGTEFFVSEKTWNDARSEYLARLSPEEREAIKAEQRRRGWETRKKNKEMNGQVQSSGGHRGPDRNADGSAVAGDHGRTGGQVAPGRDAVHEEGQQDPGGVGG